jgi:hypothetical protein
MSYTLEQFAADCKAALAKDAGPSGREAVRKLVERACSDRAFVDTHLGPANDSPRKLLYEDPELGFCIFAHAHKSMNGSRPHDHGPTWAIYGQAVGTTEMVDWRVVAPGKVAERRRYTLEPGHAHIYQEGDIHSPDRAGATRLIRIEGMNMDGVERSWFEAC